MLSDIGINYKIKIIANDDFSEKILEPILSVIDDVADTSELFIRSLQMYNLFANKKPITGGPKQPNSKSKASQNLDAIQP